MLAGGMEELSGAGAAFTAGQALGLFTAKEAAARLEKRADRPAMDARQREALLAGWQRAVRSVLG